MASEELNGLHFDVLEEPPTPSEFMRLVHISRPVVLKGTFLSNSPENIDIFTLERTGSFCERKVDERIPFI